MSLSPSARQPHQPKVGTERSHDFLLCGSHHSNCCAGLRHPCCWAVYWRHRGGNSGNGSASVHLRNCSTTSSWLLARARDAQYNHRCYHCLLDHIWYSVCISQPLQVDRH
jgi:hypothetical protein